MLQYSRFYPCTFLNVIVLLDLPKKNTMDDNFVGSVIFMRDGIRVEKKAALATEKPVG